MHLYTDFHLYVQVMVLWLCKEPMAMHFHLVYVYVPALYSLACAWLNSDFSNNAKL